MIAYCNPADLRCLYVGDIMEKTIIERGGDCPKAKLDSHPQTFD